MIPLPKFGWINTLNTLQNHSTIHDSRFYLKKTLFHVVTPKFQCIYHMLLFTWKKKNYQTDPKINQNWAWHKLSCPLHKKNWSQTPLCLQLWIGILIATSKLFGSSKQMVQVVSSVRDNLCESFPIFYLSIHVWNHGILINLVIFRLQMFFLQF